MAAPPPPPLVSPEVLVVGALVTACLVAWYRTRLRFTPAGLADLGASLALATPAALLVAALVGELERKGVDLATALPWDQGVVPRYVASGLTLLLGGGVLTWAWRARRACRAAEATCDPYPALRGRASLP